MAVSTMQGRAAPQATRSGDRIVQSWLFVVAGIVLLMVVVGGATRLTDSGLSITEWQPILGAIPPLSEADWLSAFEKYKQIPEYDIVNKGMSIEEFKLIYWWEWAHRFLGRFIGVAFAVPFLMFWALGMLRRGLAPQLFGVLALGGVQGFIGWFMVQSGLVDRVDVSQYRLALHLSVAFLIFGALIWLALSLGGRTDGVRLDTVSQGQRRLARLIVVFLFMQVGLGALVAGLKAGLAYNTWPLMDGWLVPDDLGVLEPWYLNFFENVATVQFQHRMTAYAVVVLVLWHAWRLMQTADDERIVRSAGVLAVAALVQAGLGIWTLLAHVPLALGLAHQGGAAILFAIAIWHLYRMKQSQES